MEVLFLILPMALVISLGFVLCFIYAVKNGQYDDLETPAFRILLDDDNHTTQVRNNNDSED